MKKLFHLFLKTSVCISVHCILTVNAHCQILPPISSPCTTPHPKVYVPVSNANGSYPIPIDAQPIDDALKLYTTLFYYSQLQNCSSQPLIISFAPNSFIDLGGLPPEVFPIEIPINTKLLGDYAFGNVTGEPLSEGTKIFYPYLFEYGLENDVPSFSTLDFLCDDDYGSAFKMLENSKIFNICLYGPTPDVKDYRYGEWLDKFWDLCSKTYLPPQEGINSGIEVQGNNCEIAYCEIFGFRHFAVQVIDMIKLLGSGFHHNCVSDAVNTVGRFDLHHNYIHHNKSAGYGLWYLGECRTCS